MVYVLFVMSSVFLFLLFFSFLYKYNYSYFVFYIQLNCFRRKYVILAKGVEEIYEHCLFIESLVTASTLLVYIARVCLRKCSHLNALLIDFEFA